MSLKRSASNWVRAFVAIATRASLKLPPGHTPKVVIAAVALILCWTIGPLTGFRNYAADDDLATIEPVLEGLRNPPFIKPHTPEKGKEREKDKDKDRDKGNMRVSSDQQLSFVEAENFCYHYHLQPYNSSASPKANVQQAPLPGRRVYDLLVISTTTSADMLELRLASMYQHVDYFIMLEAPSINAKDPTAHSEPSSLTGAPVEPPSLLDKIWTSHLSAYQAKIIRHSLSQFSHDFKDGLDHTVTTRNALYTRVIPLLTGSQKVQPGDILLISDVEELVRPVAMKVLRNCNVPERTTIRTRKYWYSYQWMKVDGRGATPDPEAAEHKEAEQSGVDKKPVHPWLRKDGVGNEWWPHPQVTVYQGADTLLPDDLRRSRDLDQYVLGDGGWTCHLCYPTITETLGRIGEMGVIWHDGPRWKAAGRVVDRVANGIDIFDRTNLSRIDANPDVPPYLSTNAHRYSWMLDRDAPGANFNDFDPTIHERYIAKKKEVDAQPDFETTRPDLEFNLENTQDGSPPPPPLPPTAWRGTSLPGDDQDDGGFVVKETDSGGTGLSETDRNLLDSIKSKAAGLSPEDIRVLEGLVAAAP